MDSVRLELLLQLKRLLVVDGLILFSRKLQFKTIMHYKNEWGMFEISVNITSPSPHPHPHDIIARKQGQTFLTKMQHLT